MKKRQRKLIVQFAEYMISGGAYFWSGYLIFFAADKGLHWSLWWAKLASNIFGWTVNYLLQRYWVFKNPHLKDHLAKTTGRYMFITLVDFILDYFIVAGLKAAGLTPYLGQFVSAGFFTVWNYLWYRFWVFPDKHRSAARRPVKHSVARHLASRHAAVSKSPVLSQRISYTPPSALRFFLAAYSSERRLSHQVESEKTIRRRR